MDVLEALYTTRSMRRVTSEPIPEPVQASILDSAIRAPSGSNRQPWRFVLVDDPEIRHELGVLYREAFDLTMEHSYASKVAEQPEQATPESLQFDRVMRSGKWLADHFHDVPLLLFPYAFEDPSGKDTYPAVWSAMLAARAHGVGSTITTILSTYRATEVASLLGAPTDGGWQNPCAITFGYPTGRWDVAPREPAAEMSFRNGWDGPLGFELAEPLWPAAEGHPPH